MAKEKKNRIGSKGLENIFGDGINDLIVNIENSSEMQQNLAKEIQIAKIVNNPYQPRKNFNPIELQELSASIKTHGLIQPIIVKKTASSEFYQLIAGERRKKASELAGLTTIKAVVIDVTDQQVMEFALIENIQRVDLNAFEEAQAYQTLISKMKWTQEQLANKVNKSRPYIANTLRILQLPAEVLKLVNDQKLTMGHVRPLLQLTPDNEQIVKIAYKMIAEKWSVRQIEDYLKHALTNRHHKLKLTTKAQHIVDLETKISHLLLGTKVEIKPKKLIIKYKNNQHLNEILDILKIND